MCMSKKRQTHLAGVKRNKGKASTMAMVKSGDNAKAGLIIMEVFL